MKYRLWADKQRSGVFLLKSKLPAPPGLGAGLGEAVPPSDPGGGREPGDIVPWRAIEASSLESTGQEHVTYLNGEAPHTVCKKPKYQVCLWL